MSDYAHEPAGLVRVARRFDALADDSKNVDSYWSAYAVPLAHQTGKGIPALGLPKLSELTPGVNQQTAALRTHITTVSKALDETADMFSKVAAENKDKVKTIWGNVPGGEDESGRSSGGLHNIKVPSERTLNTAPQPSGMELEQLGVGITTLLRDLESERIFFAWVDKLLGAIFGGKNPTEHLLEWFVGDWRALSTVGDIFEHFEDYTDLMQGMLIDTGKSMRTEGQWQGPSVEAAFTRVCSNANRLDGLQKIWHEAGNKYDAWASATYVMLAEVQNNLAMIPSLIAKGKKIVIGLKDIAVIGVDIILNTAQAVNKWWELIRQLLGVGLAILDILKKVVQSLFWILQALYSLMLTVGAMVSGDANLERAW